MKILLIVLFALFLLNACNERAGSAEADIARETAEKPELQASLNDLDLFVGKYKMDPPFDHIEITNESDGLFAKETSMPRIPIARKSEYVFAGSGATFTFSKNSADKIIGLNLLVKGKELKGIKVRD